MNRWYKPDTTGNGKTPYRPEKQDIVGKHTLKDLARAIQSPKKTAA